MKTPIQFAAALALGAVAAAAGAQTAARQGYVIELADAPAASYEGTIAGLAATKPAAGTKLNVSASNVQAYVSYLDAKAALVTATVPAAQVYYRYGVAFNGFAAKLTPAEVQKLSTNPAVRAITVDEPRALDTSYTPSFLGINKPGGAWSITDAAGRKVKGEDVIIAHVDSGVWPENPSFSDKVDPATGKPVPYHAAGTVVYGAPPAKWKGTCQTGLGFTAAMCNNKLIGAQYFNTGWKASSNVTWPLEYLDSPRDEDGHGSHTLATAGGNENTDVTVGSTLIQGASGIAPRARVAAYKVCYTNQEATGARGRGGCFPSDSVAAINKAVADGVDVINFSISGSTTSVRDAVETAFFNAAAAGVFVSASAGNSNVTPGNAPTVAHNSPWVMTVGNSTHDRYTEATVSLGSGATVSGASFQTAGLPSKPLIWARDAGFGASAAEGSNQALCFGGTDGVAALLDPVKVAGKILVCDRGGNVLVNKVANAKAAGALGVIIQNTPSSANTTPLINGELPTVHVALSGFTAVTTEARAVGGAASFSGGVYVPGTVAPVMAGTSSRGWNQADLNVLKPDITAPGTDIIAAYSNRSVDATQRAGIIAGTFIPGPGADMISGTSMSSPHSAGIAALLRQANPTWSPYAIKSAMMTSAVQTVKLASGAADTVRWGYGAGHVNPNAALATTLVYDQTVAEHVNYYLGSLSGSALNLASMTAANVIGTQTFTRKVTNKGSVARTYTASGSVPGYNLSVSPSTFTVAPGASQTFTATVTRTTAAIGSWVFGAMTWTGDDGSTVRSPITVRGQTFVASTTVTDTRATGTKVFTVATGYNGAFSAAATGLVPATRFTGTVATGDLVCYPFTVPAGARMLRAQMFNSETGAGAASDIDLIVYRGGSQVGYSGSGTTDELITLNNPTAATTYEVCADGYGPAAGNDSFVINLWVVPGTATATPLKAFGPATATIGGMASVGVSWAAEAGKRHLGVVDYRQGAGGTLLGSSTVFIDATAAVPATATVSRIKAAN